MYRIRTYNTILAALIGLTLLFAHASAQADVAGVFSKGRTHFAIYGGTGYAFNDDYFVIGASGSYYFANGFNLGLGAEVWTGGNPDISKITPSIQYVFFKPSVVKPYVGAFYRKTFIDDMRTVAISWSPSRVDRCPRRGLYCKR